uniref:Transmembrane protein n=1 Tax=Meloidogyne hapla TaxID=6305 RepID=A0A1I8BPF0_MELHA
MGDGIEPSWKGPRPEHNRLCHHPTRCWVIFIHSYSLQVRTQQKQSIRRLKYKRHPAARIDDVPDVALPDQMFNESACKSKSVDKTFIDKEIDPYIDSETGMLPQCTEQCTDSSNSSSHQSSESTIKAASPSKCKSKTRRPKAKQKRSKSVSRIVVSATAVATAAILPTSPPVKEQLFEGIIQKQQHRREHRSASPALGKFNKIRRQLRVAVLKRNEGKKPSKKASAESKDISEADDEEENDEEEEEEKSYGMSTEAVGDGNDEDGFDCCVQLWNILVKIVRLMFEAGNYVLDHKLLFYPLAIIFAYLCLGVLHSIFASILASIAGWIWPPLHFILSTTAGFAWRLADWLSWVDELGRSLICDMAASYCRRYRLLCDRQCSFVDRAVEHSHRSF